MKCESCGTDTSADALFCHRCGVRLTSPDSGHGHVAGDARAEGTNVGNRADGAANAVAGEVGAARDDFVRKVGAGGRDIVEQDVWQGGFSPRAMLGSWILAGLATVLLIVVGIFFWRTDVWLGVLTTVLMVWIFLGSRLLYRQMSVRYRLTNQRFFHETGIIRRVTNRIEVIDMDDITFEQGPIERVTGVGSIRIRSTDRSDPDLCLIGIDDVKEVAARIDKVRRAEKLRRSLHIENV
jgi:membrane protein YdbS with pleckstrin-like domain